LKKKVVKLQDTNAYDNYLLIGISSHENDYRVSWTLNIHLGLKLAKSQNITIPLPKFDDVRSFSCYRYYDDNNMNQFMLIANTSEQGYLFPEYKNIDFVLKISGEAELPLASDMLNVLKPLDIIALAFEIPLGHAKNEKYLLWD
jgi:hypothetical protein